MTQRAPRFVPDAANPALGVTPSAGANSVAASAGVGDIAIHLAAGIAIGDVLAVVVELLAPAQADLQLGAPAAGDVHLERHQRQALGFGTEQESQDLVAVKQ
jgi:hypothetical protein